MKNSKWREYRNGSAAWGQLPQWPTQPPATITNLGDAPLRLRETVLAAGASVWLCRWCSHENAIGLGSCEDCAMPRLS